MALSMDFDRFLHNHGAMTQRLARLIGALAALTLASACASGVRVAANGRHWGAPVSASVRLATTVRPHRRHHAYNRAAPVPAPGMIGTPSGQKIGRPYQVAGRTYFPARQDDYDEIGVASWYGPKFQGRRTANGEVFDMNALSAAHTTLPLPSLVRVTNLGNGRSIIVRVNDRGPFVGNRLIDLSRAAASELGYLRQGTARVRVQYVGPAVSNPGDAPRRASVRQAVSSGHDAQLWPAPGPAAVQPPSPHGAWFVQAASFSRRESARRIASRLSYAGRARVQSARVNRRKVHRVLLGPYGSRAEAEGQRRVVAAAGYPDARVTVKR